MRGTKVFKVTTRRRIRHKDSVWITVVELSNSRYVTPPPPFFNLKLRLDIYIASTTEKTVTLMFCLNLWRSLFYRHPKVCCELLPLLSAIWLVTLVVNYVSSFSYSLFLSTRGLFLVVVMKFLKMNSRCWTNVESCPLCTIDGARCANCPVHVFSGGCHEIEGVPFLNWRFCLRFPERLFIHCWCPMDTIIDVRFDLELFYRDFWQQKYFAGGIWCDKR